MKKIESDYTIRNGLPFPNRRNGCDICNKDVPTEFFAGFRKNSLWICGKCYDKITGGVERKHPYKIHE